MFYRCLKPPDSIGDPELVIFSYGSEVAHGCAASIGWRLQHGHQSPFPMMTDCSHRRVYSVSLRLRPWGVSVIV